MAMDFHYWRPLFPWPRGRGLRLRSRERALLGRAHPHGVSGPITCSHPSGGRREDGFWWRRNAVDDCNCPPHGTLTYKRPALARSLLEAEPATPWRIQGCTTAWNRPPIFTTRSGIFSERRNAGQRFLSVAPGGQQTYELSSLPADHPAGHLLLPPSPPRAALG